MSGRTPRYGRVAFYAASSAIVAWAALVVPLPFIEYLPGSPTPIAPLVQIEGTETTELDGEAALLTVYLRQQPTVPAFGALLDDRRSLLPITEVYAPGQDRRERLRVERERFGRQFDIAAAVGAQAAGVELELVTEVAVVDVVPDSPADGVLTVGDTILEVDGEPIVAGEELQDLVRSSSAGDVLVLTVRRGEAVEHVEAELADAPGTDTPRLGVAIETAVVELRLPFEVELAEETDIGGPSAGLMIALTVYDLLSDEDLLQGRQVFGTGTVDADGRVGPVGGVSAKMRAAAAHGADLVLVPRLQLDEALQGAPEGLQIAGVDSLDEALDVLTRSSA